MLPEKHLCCHSIIGSRLSEGQAFSCGSNQWGQLGTGDNTSRYYFSQTSASLELSSISCGLYQSAGITREDGSICILGLNYVPYLKQYDENGNVYRKPKFVTQFDHPIIFTPVKVRFSSVVVGDRFLSALDEEGFVYHFSEIEQERLKGVLTLASHRQILNTFLCGIVQLSAGSRHLLALDNRGKVWDVNPYTVEEPRRVEIENHVLQMASGSSYDLFRDKDHRVLSRKRSDKPRFILQLHKPADGSGDSALRVQCGSHSSYITDGYGIVRVFGCNNYGQLGLGENHSLYVSEPIVNHSLTGMKLFPIQNWLFCSDNAGRIYGCGNNYSGQLGTGDYTNRWSIELITTAVISDYHDNDIPPVENDPSRFESSRDEKPRRSQYTFKVRYRKN